MRQLRRVSEKAECYTGRIEAVSAQLDEARRLLSVPGIGPIVASTLVAMAGDWRSGLWNSFKSGGIALVRL